MENRVRCQLAVGLVAAFFVMMIVCSSFPAFAYADENANSVSSKTYAGETRFDTAVEQSKAAFSNSEYAILVGSEGWPDALSVSGLSGALSCPILYSATDSLPSAISSEMDRLGVQKVLIVGGQGSVGSAVESSLQKKYQVVRLGGENRYETQSEIYEYGVQNSLWGSDFVFFANGESFPDALSVSAVAYAHKSPIFLTSGDLSESQEGMLLSAADDGCLKGQAVVVGGESAISQKAEGFISGVNLYGSSNEHSAIRLSGEDRYQTNSNVNEWAVSNAGMTWKNIAFASGEKPYDALTGSGLQGRQSSLIALVGNAYSSSIGAAARNVSSIGEYRVFGGNAAISSNLKKYINYSLRFGYALPMGGTQLSDGSYIWSDWSGVYREDNSYYSWWLERANWYSSATNWEIIVDTSSNQVVVFERPRGKWIVNRTMTCTSGAWNTPTVKGQFVVGSRGKSFGHGYTCWYWTQFYGNYLFHSVLYNPGSMTSVQDGRLGINASHGCVRLAIDNAKWIYDTIPSGTRVVVW